MILRWIEPEIFGRLYSATCRELSRPVGEAYWFHHLSALPLELSDDITACDVVTQWRDDEYGDWHCYWYSPFDVNGDVLPEAEAIYVFKPRLECTIHGIVRTIDDFCSEAAPAHHVYKVVQGLRALRPHLTMVGFGDEGGSRWFPFLIPWCDDDRLTPEALLNKLGAHHEITSSICQPGGTHWDSDGVPMDAELLRFLHCHGKAFADLHTFYAGSDKLNPVPVFAVAHMRPGLVAGLVSGIVHT